MTIIEAEELRFSALHLVKTLLQLYFELFKFHRHIF